MRSPPTVSVILPAYNAEKTIARAIDSVLGQTYQDFELIVLNDGSTDRTRDIVGTYSDQRIRVVNRDKNEGLIAVLNQGLALASGKYIARQDADDESTPNRFREQVAALESEVGLAVIGSATFLRSENGKVFGSFEYPRTAELSEWQALFKTPVAHSATISRKEALVSAGGYSSKFKYAEDFELWSRVLTIGGIRNLNNKLIYYSLSQGGVSQKHRRAQDEMHVRIAALNLKKLLGCDLDPEVVRALTLSVDRVDEGVEKSCALESIRTLFEIQRVYLSNFKFRSNLVSVVRADCVNRVGRLFRKLTYRDRVENLRILPKDVFANGMALYFIGSAFRP